MGNVENETLVDTLAATLSEMDVKSICDTLRNVKSLEITHTITDTKENAETGRQTGQ